MKLYDPSYANSYIWPMVPKGAKPNEPCQYKATRDESPALWTDKGWTMAGPHCTGRYDMQGLFETYCPPVPGASGSQGLGRFIPHPFARDEMKRETGWLQSANDYPELEAA